VECDHHWPHWFIRGVTPRCRIRRWVIRQGATLSYQALDRHGDIRRCAVPRPERSDSDPLARGAPGSREGRPRARAWGKPRHARGCKAALEKRVSHKGRLQPLPSEEPRCCSDSQDCDRGERGPSGPRRASSWPLPIRSAPKPVPGCEEPREPPAEPFAYRGEKSAAPGRESRRIRSFRRILQPADRVD
jgi:hypothetical protein